MPDTYTDPQAELIATRRGVSMGDMSVIPKTEVRGPDAQACVDYLITRDASKIGVGNAWYTTWCNDDGKVVSDGIVFRFEPERFLFAGDRSASFFRQHADRFDVEIEDVSDGYGILALQGPLSREVLDAATGEDWSDLRFSRLRSTEIGGTRVDVVRQGFTGELGFELWVDRPAGHAVWEAVAASGADLGVQPVGEYAIDIARVEAGLILISADYTGAGPDPPLSDVPPEPHDFVTPYELGLDHCVNLAKAADFIGRDALAAERASGPARRIVGLVFDVEEIIDLHLRAGLAPNVSPRVRWDQLRLRHGDQVAGRATSVTWSPTTSSLIGFGLVPAELTDTGTELVVEWADFWGNELGDASAVVTSYPFIELRRES